MGSRITREQGEAALAAVKAAFAPYLSSGWDEPVLEWDWDWLESGPTACAIVWEEGPEEWALHLDVVPVEAGSEKAAQWKPGDWPVGVWYERVNTFALSLYPL